MSCIANDPSCPCQDGDICHYRGPNAWPLPSPLGSNATDRMIEELIAGGWKKKTASIWQSPAGALWLGPVQAWKVMVRGGKPMA